MDSVSDWILPCIRPPGGFIPNGGFQRLYRSHRPLDVGPVGKQSQQGGADSCQINGMYQYAE